MEKANILIVEDEILVANNLKEILENQGYNVIAIVKTGEKAIEKAKDEKPDIIIMDIKLKGKIDGIKASEIIRFNNNIPVIFLTSYVDEALIERAKITESFGYLLKPITDHRQLCINIEMAIYKLEMENKLKQANDQLEKRVIERTEKLNNTLEQYKNALAEIKELKKLLQVENTYLKEEIKLNSNFEEIIGQSNEIKAVLLKVEQVAPSNTTVLILGETGTGKELIARAIHNSSPQKDRALIKIDCSALSPNLIESELFGHEKGSFTGAHVKKIGRFELANGSSIFLDEIGELPFELQSKLLRVIQDGEFERLGGTKTIKTNARVIAATNRDLSDESNKGSFRKDLFFRLNVFPIIIPPLRERKDDIILLLNYFTQKFSKKIGKNIKKISKRISNKLENYTWPGNVRELENLIERAIIISNDDTLKIELPESNHISLDKELKLEDVERKHIIKILNEKHWKIEGAGGTASTLGINPSTLRSRMKKLGIKRLR
ncbi:MAG: sigma-54-dependent Fis family transcriptional regulator [Desulfobacterales bacterium]|nr:sigma-54-dependent Fis family transcriptional regulator [Desulfobacterales bacterium]